MSWCCHDVVSIQIDRVDDDDDDDDDDDAFLSIWHTYIQIYRHGHINIFITVPLLKFKIRPGVLISKRSPYVRVCT